ncbi:amino acid transporter [Malassezia pachydermatis]|uniref:Amino acid transporter n=1 Tax=Malassezia pachydermatis TaxID=77020 RepID=A0A0M8MNK4_9BASI|nr:amino acid transporter [Malassezia pachydermatis]KOS13707.1 amino acid transporter [Malassezia pachydermatis]
MSDRRASGEDEHFLPSHKADGSPISSPTQAAQADKETLFEADSDGLNDDVLAMPDPSMVAPISAADADGHHSYREAGMASRTSLDLIGQGMREGMRHISQALPPHWDAEQLPEWLRRGAGVFEGTVNMANSILGAGIVGLPYSMRESGFVAGLVLLLGIALLTDWTIRLIVLNAKLSGRGTYIDIMGHCFGQYGRIAVSVFQFVFAFGGMCAFCVVVGDTIPNVISSIFPFLRDTFLSNRQFVIVLCTMAISFPLSLYRNIESLSKASAVALVSMVIIILAVVVRGPAMPAELKGDPALRFTIIHPMNVTRSIAVLSFAFVCHHNSLLIYGSLKEPSMDKFRRVTHYSTFISAMAATAMSIAGYWSFEDKTLSNILNNFPQTDLVVNIARFCFGLNMFTTLPLECFVCREVLETYFFEGEYERKRHIILTTSLVVSSMMVSLLTCDLGIVLELTGGLSATALAFFFPSVCYLKLSHDASQVDRSALYFAMPTEEADELSMEENHEQVVAENISLPLRPGANASMRQPQQPFKWWESTKLLSIACAIFGALVLTISVITALADAWSGRSGATHQC